MRKIIITINENNLQYFGGNTYTKILERKHVNPE